MFEIKTAVPVEEMSKKVERRHKGKEVILKARKNKKEIKPAKRGCGDPSDSEGSFISTGSRDNPWLGELDEDEARGKGGNTQDGG